MAIGGAPISQMFADEIGADGYGQNASAAVDLFLRLAQEADAARARRRRRLMASYKVLYWQEVPSQIKVEDDADDVTLQMPDRFQERIDAWPPSAAWAARTTTWRSGAGARKRIATARPRTWPRPCEPSSKRRPAFRLRMPPACGAAARRAAVIGTVPDRVPATLTLNGQTTAAVPGLTLFEHAERLGVRVPTSCRKQGKCKECLVEVTEGQERCRRRRRRSSTCAATSACRAGRRSAVTTPTSAATRCGAASCASSPAAPTSRRGTPAWRSIRR